MSQNILYQWNIYCVTEGKFKTVWLPENDPAPTSCPSSTASDVHDVNPSSVSREEGSRMGDVALVSIKENDGTTGGAFYSAAHDLVAHGPTSTVTTQVFSYPVNRSISLGDFVYSAEQAGDVISVSVAPHTTLGVVTGALVNTTVNGQTFTTVPVSSTVFTRLKKGHFMNLYNGTARTGDYCVESLDSINKTVTVTPSIDVDGVTYAPMSTYFQFSIFMIKDRTLGPGPAHLTVGESVIGGSTIPKNVPFVITYVNNSPEPFIAKALASIAAGDTFLRASNYILNSYHSFEAGTHYFKVTDGTTTSQELKFTNYDATDDGFVVIYFTPAIDVAFTYDAALPTIKIQKTATKVVTFAVEGMY